MVDYYVMIKFEAGGPETLWSTGSTVQSAESSEKSALM